MSSNSQQDRKLEKIYISLRWFLIKLLTSLTDKMLTISVLSHMYVSSLPMTLSNTNQYITCIKIRVYNLPLALYQQI